MKEEIVQYFNKITSYLKSDISALNFCDDKGKDVGCGPFLLTTCSGIANLGEILFPDVTRDEPRFTNYIKKYLGQVEAIYKRNNVDKFIYKHIRCGQVHEGIVKSGVLIGKKLDRTYHLVSLLIDGCKGNVKKIIYFNPKLFADDFIKSLKFCEKDLKNTDALQNVSIFLKQRYDLHENDLDKYRPELDEKKMDYNNFGSLYESASSTPYFPGGMYLKEDFWKELI